ncbi:MAG: hypothetical protein NTW38_06590 [Candidatus Aminicenantes bacterium]|nr:hypothetical protein [Candidatus Aminicenantes bacterium]
METLAAGRDIARGFHGSRIKIYGRKSKLRVAGAEKMPQVKQAPADAAKEIERIFKS